MTYDNGQIMTWVRQPGHPGEAKRHPSRRFPFWCELVRTQGPVIYEDIAGLPVHTIRQWLVDKGVRRLLNVPLLLGRQVIGFLSIPSTRRSSYQPEEVELAQAIAHQATLAVQLTRLAEQGQQSAVLAERNRIAREIHDTLAQGLAGIVVQLQAAEDAHITNPEDRQSHIARARELARENLAEARRSVWALRPHALDGSDLCGAFTRLAEQMVSPAGVETTCQVRGTPRALPPEVERNLLRIGQEAFTNTVKHAGARAVRIELTFETGRVRLRVRDDGRGFDPAAPAGESGRGAFGLIGMRERAQDMGGRLTVTSQPGRGTEVAVVVPV